jgi:hypothetical protein
VIAATVRPVTALGEEEPAKLVLSWPLSEPNNQQKCHRPDSDRARPKLGSSAFGLVWFDRMFYNDILQTVAADTTYSSFVAPAPGNRGVSQAPRYIVSGGYGGDHHDEHITEVAQRELGERGSAFDGRRSGECAVGVPCINTTINTSGAWVQLHAWRQDLQRLFLYVHERRHSAYDGGVIYPEWAEFFGKLAKGRRSFPYSQQF